MAATTTNDEILAREQLRTFHLSGLGLDDAAPGRALHPTILDSLTLEGQYPTRADAEGLVVLHAAALAESRQPQRERFWGAVQHTAARLREILFLDESHAPGAVTTESVSASLGSQVGAFINPGMLAKAIQRPANPLRRMNAERRSRCETTLVMLDEALHDAASQPAFWLFHSGIFGSTEAPENVVLIHGGARWALDSFFTALQFCDSRLDRLTHLLRALRVARLEIDSAFDPLVHEEMLARFDWQSASADELNALPPIVVVETAGNLGRVSLTSFGRLLRSGRPVQMLIVDEGLEARDLEEFTPDFGYLSIAHREVFVLQSSMAEPAHLLPGLAAMTKTLRTAVAVVAAPRPGDDDRDDERESWIAERLMVLSRAFPLYTYQPDAGVRWTEHFSLFTPPVNQELTAAHAASVTPSLRQQFRVIPAALWTSDQMELSEYLAAWTTRAPLAVPYIWVEHAGERKRALLTRDLANFCMDRRRAWAMFEDLSGAGKPEPVANETAESIRQAGARQAIEQVIALLADN